MTLNLGVRYDHHVGIIPSFNRLDLDGQPTGEKIPGFDPVFTWNNISPRIGFAYAAGAEQKTVIRGSFGVYYDGNVSGNWDAPPPFGPTFNAYWGESWDGPWDDEPSWDWSPGDLSVDPDLKAPRTLQYSLGFEQGIGANCSFGVTGLYKDTKDLVGWQIMDDGVYEEFEWTDPFTGDQYTLLDPIVAPNGAQGQHPGLHRRSHGRPLLAGVLGDHPHLQPALRRLLEHAGVLHLLRVDRSDRGVHVLVPVQPALRQPRRLRPQLLPQRQRPAAAGRPAAHAAGAGELRAALDHEPQHHDQLPERPALQPPVLRADDRLSAGGHCSGGQQGLRHGFQYLWDLGIGKRFNLGGDVALQLDLQLLNLLNSTPTDVWQTEVLEEGDDVRWLLVGSSRAACSCTSASSSNGFCYQGLNGHHPPGGEKSPPGFSSSLNPLRPSPQGVRSGAP